MEKIKKKSNLSAAMRSVLEVLVALAAVATFTSLILFFSGSPFFAPYIHILKGSVGSWVKFSHVLKAWIPLVLCSCGLLYTFKIGLWNIGVEGQMMMGAVAATMILRLDAAREMPFLFLILSFAFGILGGGLWAMLAGFLKTKGGVNEIFAGLGLNFVAQGAILWLIFGPWKRPGIASMSGTELFPRELWLPYIHSLRISPVGLTLAFTAILVTAFMLRYTKIGLRFNAVGNNPNAAFLFGIRPGRYMLLAMIFAGGFAGLAGSLQVTGVYHRLLPAISSNYGYLALLVVMLANYKAWIAPFIALFFACLNVGAIQLPMMLRLDSSFSGVIQGALVLAILAVHALRMRKP